jgi:hypothetical protein
MEMMKPFIQAGDWRGLESESEMRCRAFAGEPNARRISRIPVRAYEASLSTGIALSISKARALAARSIYFEVDMDYNWRSWFFICPNYPARWNRLLGSDYVEEVDGPEMPRFFNIYRTFDAFTPTETTMESYLVARTYACFGRAGHPFANSGVAMAMGFHDPGELVRFYGDTKKA